MKSLIAKKYAQALLEIDGINLDEVLNELSAIAALIQSDESIKEFVNSPLVKNDAKYQALIAPIEDKLDKKVANLLKLMAQKGRLSLIPDLVYFLSQEIKIRKNSFSGVVESSEDIDKSLIEKLEKKLSIYSNAKVTLESKKSDIDGIKVEVNDLGLELNFSKSSVKNALIEHIQKAL